MNYKIKVNEDIKKDLEKALKNFSLFLDVCKKQNIAVTESDKEVIIQLITTMVENDFNIDTEEIYLDYDFMLGVKERHTKYDFLSYPDKFLHNLREDIKNGFAEYLDEQSLHIIEVEWEDTQGLTNS